MAKRKIKIIIKDTHRGLWYEDGALTKVLEAGRYKIRLKRWLFFPPKPLVEVVLVDMRERDLTSKGQEILTSDKVALRVSIIVQFLRRSTPSLPRPDHHRPRRQAISARLQMNVTCPGC